MNQERINEIRKELSKFVTVERGRSLRSELKDIADKTYIQKYTDTEQIDFLDRNEVRIFIENLIANQCDFEF